MKISFLTRQPLQILLSALISVLYTTTPAQSRQSNFSLADAKTILKVIKEDVKKHYYDPTYRGLNLDQHFQQAEARLKAAENPNQMFTVIAQTLLDFQDSHLYFVPPQRAMVIDYGFTMEVVGDGVYVRAVTRNSPADMQGLSPGDRILQINNIAALRETLPTLQYLLQVLRPQQELLVRLNSVAGKELSLEVKAQITPTAVEKQMDYFAQQRRFDQAREKAQSVKHEFGKQVMIWKIPSFQLDPADLSQMKGRLKPFPTLILDLRDNSGGYVDSCLSLLSLFFAQPLHVADNKGRQKTTALTTRSNDEPYVGKVFALVNAQSASAAEITARVLQIEKRAVVIGDRTAGAVMTARPFRHAIGMDIELHYGLSVTVADTIMADGKSLEKTGVTPDQYRLPSPKDLLQKRDTQLSYVLELAGIKLSPEEAFQLLHP